MREAVTQSQRSILRNLRGSRPSIRQKRRHFETLAGIQGGKNIWYTMIKLYWFDARGDGWVCRQTSTQVGTCHLALMHRNDIQLYTYTSVEATHVSLKYSFYFWKRKHYIHSQNDTRNLNLLEHIDGCRIKNMNIIPAGYTEYALLPYYDMLQCTYSYMSMLKLIVFESGAKGRPGQGRQFLLNMPCTYWSPVVHVQTTVC